jgi:hypothetical protein
MILFDFSQPDLAVLFHPIGDRVMGGVSSGALSSWEDCAVFSGEVSFLNQGGFASVRSKAGAWDLSAFTGIELKVRSDGKVYKLSLTTDPRYDSVVYRASFSPPADEWATVRIPFQECSPTFRGEKVPAAPPLDPSLINTFGLLISDRQEGDFRLGIKSISAY